MARAQSGNKIIILGAVLIPVDIAAVFMRVWARRLKRMRLRLCDYLIIISLFLNFCNYTCAVLFVTKGGVGKHIKFTTNDERITSLKLFVAAPILYGVTTCLMKLSVLTFYLDIFTHNKKTRAICHALIVLNIALMLANILATFLLCHPFAYSWNKKIRGGHCGSSTEKFLAIAGVNMFSDFATVLFPIPAVWKLQMPTRKKVAVIVIIGLGVLTSIFGALRIHSIRAIKEPDFTGTVLPDIIWAAMELVLGIMTACLPILQPPLVRLVGRDSPLRSLLHSATSTVRSGGSRHRGGGGGGTDQQSKSASSGSQERFDHTYPVELQPQPYQYLDGGSSSRQLQQQQQQKQGAHV